LLVWALLAGAVWADGDFTAELAQINTSRYPEITLYVSVADRAGQIVEGLQQGDFRITENGVPVDIIAFSAGSRTSIATVLTIDRSGSMSVEGKLQGAKTAAETFVNLMRAQDRAALVAFESSVVTLQPFTSDKAALKAQIRSLSADGCTTWYDAIYQSVDLITPLEGRRSVILLSDGIDCREDLLRRLAGYGSSHDLNEAIQRAQKAGIPVYAIGLGQKATQAVGNEGFDEVKLRRVATETGGKYYHAPSAAELKQLYSSLSTTMQKEYMLTYRSPRPTYDGTRRDIAVTVQRSGEPGATTQGRYLEQHLVHVRSDPRLFLAFFVPLLLLLIAPTIGLRVKHARETSGQVVKGPEGASAVGQPSMGRESAQPQMHVAPPLAAPVVAPASAPGGTPSRLVARFPLVPGETSIGRAADNDIVLSDASVAAHHACMTLEGGRCIVRDLSNGQTYVSYRGDPAQERPTGQNALRDGSTIRFGQVRAILRQPQDSAGAWIEVAFALIAPLTIGRDPVNRIVVNSPQVAPRQAEIVQEAGRWAVSDLAGGAVFISFSGDPTRARAVQGTNALKVGSTMRVGNVVLELQA
jgi:VWFA-related protein